MRPRSTYHMHDPEPLPSYQESEGLTNATKKKGRGKEKDEVGINYAEWTATGKGLASAARVSKNGRIDVSFTLKKKLPDLPKDYAPQVDEFAIDNRNWSDCPPLCIVIMIVGSRGDVQPYIALGKRLKSDGHRVRIASHENFRTFVTQNGLGFFSIGGDPHELMSYMVKNPGLVPGMESLKNGDIPKKRKMLGQMLNGCWNACHSPDLTGARFMADAIISNPPAFAHVHCAEALGIPLLLTFTMPWCATGDFPHPLVNIKFSNAGERLTNYMSYAAADILTWQGMGDIINRFRNHTLGLPSLSVRSGPGLAERLKVPWTYCMSPALVPKPKDWSNHIDVVGFYFLDLATNYTPPEDLESFLAYGDTPVYIGFGSVVVEDPEEMSRIIFEATAQAGVRAVISAGWGGLGGVKVPPHVFIIGNVPHDWLFAENRVSAVVHHGGAGTTAIGLSKGRPTVVVPFFGDQEFWGDMICRAGAGPAPIPHKKLTVANLVAALVYATSPPAQQAATHMAEQIANENGISAGVEGFYRHLPLLNMRCDLCPDHIAVWWSTDHCLKLSAVAAQTLLEAREIKADALDLHRTKEYESRKQFRDPLTACASAVFWTVLHQYKGLAQIFTDPVKGIVNSTTALPKGAFKILTHTYEGFNNLPALYGSSVRPQKNVTGFGTGLIEGGKALFWGVSDGVTGLITEPYRGAKEDGAIGAVKGTARSLGNLHIKPFSGLLGVVSLPLQGAWRSVRSPRSQNQERAQRHIRTAEGQEAVRGLTLPQRQEIIYRFYVMKRDTASRRQQLAALAEAKLKEDLQEDGMEETVFEDGPSTNTSLSLDYGRRSRPSADHTAPQQSQRSKTSMQSLQADSDSEWELERRYEEDLECAYQLSLQDAACKSLPPTPYTNTYH